MGLSLVIFGYNIWIHNNKIKLLFYKPDTLYKKNRYQNIGMKRVKLHYYFETCNCYLCVRTFIMAFQNKQVRGRFFIDCLNSNLISNK